MRIAILTNVENTTLVKELLSEGKKRGHDMQVWNPNEMQLEMDPNSYDRLYLDSRRIYKSSVDAVITRLSGGLAHSTAILAHIRQNMGIFTTQTASGILNASNKLKTHQLLSLNGIPMPKTIYSASPKNVDFLIEKAGPLPVILKGLTGSQGATVMILETPLSANSVIESYYKAGIKVILQEYIEPTNPDEEETKDGKVERAKDIRAYVIGDKVVAAMRRIAPKNSFKTNVSLGAKAEPIKLTEEQEDLAIRASRVVGLFTSGVDIMTRSWHDKQDLVIEVNGCQGHKIQGLFDKKKVNIAEEYIKFVEEKWQNSEYRSFFEPAFLPMPMPGSKSFRFEIGKEKDQQGRYSLMPDLEKARLEILKNRYKIK